MIALLLAAAFAAMSPPPTAPPDIPPLRARRAPPPAIAPASLLARYAVALAANPTPPVITFEYTLDQTGAHDIQQTHRVFRSGLSERDELLTTDGKRLNPPSIHIFLGHRNRYAIEALAPRPEAYTFRYVASVHDGHHVDEVFATTPRSASNVRVAQVTIDGVTALPNLVISGLRPRCTPVAGTSPSGASKSTGWQPSLPLRRPLPSTRPSSAYRSTATASRARSGPRRSRPRGPFRRSPRPSNEAVPRDAASGVIRGRSRIFEHAQSALESSRSLHLRGLVRGRVGRRDHPGAAAPDLARRTRRDVPQGRRGAGRALRPLRSPRLPALARQARRRQHRLRLPRLQVQPRGRVHVGAGSGQRAQERARQSVSAGGERSVRVDLDGRSGQRRPRHDPRSPLDDGSGLAPHQGHGDDQSPLSALDAATT